MRPMNAESDTNTLIMAQMGAKARTAAAMLARLPAGTRDHALRQAAAMLRRDTPQILAANARDAMPSGGTLRIVTENARPAGSAARFRDQSDAVAITVTDSGAGMTSEVLARAANPFFTTKPVGKGTGLGLSQVHGLAAQSGGKIEITSELGLGTSVRIFLPRSDAKPDAFPLSCGDALAPRARMGSG